MKENRIAIIPARGGSKRIPGKNVRMFFGKPVIAWSVEAAIQSGLFNEVMVSTDDENIARIAKEYGASVPFMRSSKNADDFATTSDVLLEVLNSYDLEDRQFDVACCIYAAAPFVTPTRLNEALELLTAKKFDAVFPVIAYHQPVLRSFRRDEASKTEFIFPEFINTRTQDLPAAYYDAAQFYMFHVKQFQQKLRIFSDNFGSIVLEENEGHDIDTEEDWKLAEEKFKRRIQQI
jgi:pseudaminic acid cytidylyltransferase